MDTVSLSRKTWSCKGAPCNGLGGSIERSTRKFPRVRYPHFDTDQLPGFLRHEFGVFGLPVLEEKSREVGFQIPPKNRGQTSNRSTKLRLKIALVGKKKLGSKELPTQRKHYSPIFHGKSKEKLPYIFAFSNSPRMQSNTPRDAIVTLSRLRNLQFFGGFSPGRCKN